MLKYIIDHATAPGYFQNLCPAIRERHGLRSFALHRQRLFACHCKGHYTFFDGFTGEPITLSWPKTDANWREMDARMERLLNIAFLDVGKHNMLRYLYGLLRRLICATPLNSSELLQRLKRQFSAEFETHTFRSIDTEAISTCDCEWYGRRIDRTMHLQSCRQRCGGSAIWPENKERGLLKEVIDMEARYWILRAWVQQHPTLRRCRDRAGERNFDGGTNGGPIKLGPGFVGWGAEAGNVCG